jgi:hypothetical protein
MVPWFGGKLLLSGVELMLSQKKKVELMIQILPNLKKKKRIQKNIRAL